jgi:hypothetical protein
MVDDAGDDSWIPFADKCRVRAAKLPIDDVIARWEEAERLTLLQVRHGVLEVRWCAADGEEQTGLPPMWMWDWPRARYDRIRDALYETLPGGRVLYRVRVRARHRGSPVERRWPWQERPELLAKAGEPRKVQRELEQHFDPALQERPIAEIVEQLQKKHIVCSESSIRRALGRLS